MSDSKSADDPVVDAVEKPSGVSALPEAELKELGCPK